MKRIVLTACALAFVGAAQAASIPLKGTGGDILLQADEVIYDVNHHMVTAHGHVEIDYGGRVLLSDSVSYNQRTDVMTADGHVSLMAENGDVAFANHVVLKDKMRDGALEGFSALIGKSARMVAASATREGGTVTTAMRAAYTACQICKKTNRTPIWQVKAYRVIYDQTQHRIRFKDATIEVFGVPVLYTPYYAQSDPTVKHASGVLAPVLGTSTTLGSFVKVPVYLALSDSQDLTLEPWLTTASGEVLEGEYRQRFDNGGLWFQTSIANNPHGGISGDQAQIYSHIFGGGKLALSSDWDAGFDLALTSNETYLKRYDISYEDQLVNDLYVEDIFGRSRFAVTGYFFQDLRAGADNRNVPVALPLISFTYIPEHHLLGGQFEVDLNTVALTRDEGEDDQRLTTEARYRLPFITGNGQMITFEADARGDLYHISNANPLNLPGIPQDNQFILRGLPQLAMDWRWPFITAADHSTSYVISPIVQVIAAPYGGNQTGIPDEDSTGFEFNDEDLFSFDRLPGYDLAETGPRANAGVLAEAFFTGGTIDALFGQSFRLKSDPIFPPGSGLSGTISDFIGRFDINLPYLDLTHRIDVDEKSGNIRRDEVYLTGTLGRSSMRVSFVRLPEDDAAEILTPREEINAQAIVGLFQHWQVLAAADRDLLAGQMLDTELGAGYEDECLAISIAYRRRFTSDRDVPPSTSIILRVNLKTGDQAVQPYDLFPEDVFAFPHP
jgi:LPS-assembly protein